MKEASEIVTTFVKMNEEGKQLTEVLPKIQEMIDGYKLSNRVEPQVMQGSSSADAKSEPLPCPFCGDKVKAEKTKSLVNDSLMWTIQCRNNTCEIKPATDLYRNKKECVKHWNTRASQ